MALGGAGPLHAVRLAQELDMKRVVIPLTPGVMCALGLLLTDLRADFSSTQIMVARPGMHTEIVSIFQELLKQADHWFEQEGVLAGDRGLKMSADMRYVGQNYELAVDMPVSVEAIGAETVTEMVRNFVATHEAQYGFASQTDPVQFVTFRIEATGKVEKASFTSHPSGETNAQEAVTGARDVWFPETEGFVSCPIYERSLLRSGHEILGPAIIEQMDATTVLPPGTRSLVEPHLNLIVETGR